MPLIPWENSKVGPGIKYCPCASWFVVFFWVVLVIHRRWGCCLKSFCELFLFFHLGVKAHS